MFDLFGLAKAAETRATIEALGRSHAMIEFELDGTIRHANAKFLETMGYTLAEIRGKHHSIFVEPTHRESAEYREFWERLRRGEFQAGQFKRQGKNGKPVWIEASYNPVLDRSGRPLKIVKAAADVTLEKLRYADLLGQINAIQKSQAVIEFALDGTVLTANGNFLSTLGYSLPEIQGRHHRMFVTPEERDAAEYREFWESLRRGEYRAGRYKRLDKHGKEIWIEASYNPILDLEGKAFKVVKYATDITKQVRLLHDLRLIIDRNFGDIDQAMTALRGQSTGALQATTETSHNVQAVAAAAEELSASINEISERMTQSKAAGDAAYAGTLTADRATERLTQSTQAMSGIVELIQEIASQINLLALNATIESARAGEAGRGFAVVAVEVKNLAAQAAAATARITGEIEGIQAVASDVVGALGGIKNSIDAVREYVTATAGAVEEQGAVTREMSANMTSAASAMASVGSNIDDIASAITRSTEAIASTREAASVLAR